MKLKLLATTALFILCIWGVKISAGLFMIDWLAGSVFLCISGVFGFGGIMLACEILQDRN